jgi:hypothetical protein
MFDSLPPAEGEPISGVSSGWLWAARCSALICILIAVGGVFRESTRLGFFDSIDEGRVFPALFPYLAVLCFLFPRGKKPLAFGLGMATVTGFLGGGLGMLGFVLPIFIFCATFWIFALLWDSSAWLFWLFFISSMMLGLSAHEVFAKMRFEAKGTRGLGIAFGLGMFTAVLVSMLSSVVAGFMSLGGMR